MYNPGQGSYQPPSYKDDDKLGAKVVKDPMLHLVRYLCDPQQKKPFELLLSVVKSAVHVQMVQNSDREAKALPWRCWGRVGECQAVL